jgi:hypothetical protein
MSSWLLFLYAQTVNRRYWSRVTILSHDNIAHASDYVNILLLTICLYCDRIVKMLLHVSMFNLFT